MISDNIKIIKENIEKACAKRGISPDAVEVVGVTKTVDTVRIKEAIDSGFINHIGENRVQEYLTKYDFFKENNVKTDIIGHLQTNKVKYIYDKVSLIQSVDSFKLAKEIDKHCSKIDKVMDILIEVNIGEEESKSGVSGNEVLELAHEISELKHISIKGIMAIPPVIKDEVTQRAYFEKLYKIFVDIGRKNIDNINMEILSMGMSKDYYYGILEGANMVRIGTALFGKR